MALQPNMDVFKAKTILLVEDDEHLRGALNKALEKTGARVLVAADGAAAVDILLIETIDLVLSDIQMPHMNGVELTRYVKESNPVPVVLMTAFSDLVESKQAAELGADAFFAKPFDSGELFETLGRLLNPKTEPAPSPEEELVFYSLPIEEFTSGRNIPYPIFIRVLDKKYIRLAHQGEDLDVQRILHYKSKGIRCLYLTAKDFRSYVGFNLDLTSAVQGSKQVDRATKIKLMKHTGEILMEQIRQEGLNEVTYESAATFVENTVDLLCADSNILQLLNRIQSQADHLYAHSVGVSAFSVMIARQLHWTLPTNLFKVSMAGMLHDIGEKELDRVLLAKPRTEWGADEAQVYEQHSIRGFENVRTIASVPEDVRQVIKDHHESCTGSGFPSKLKRNAIHPLARLVGVADEFCKKIMRSPGHEGVPYEKALREMLQFQSDLLDPQFFAALMNLYKYPLPASFKKRMGYFNA